MTRRINRSTKRQQLRFELLENRQLLAAVVSLIASDATAAETLAGQEANAGSFTISRTEPFAAPLTVSYSIGGTATNGVDYAQIGSSVTIPAGAKSIVIPIAPNNDSTVE